MVRKEQKSNGNTYYLVPTYIFSHIHACFVSANTFPISKRLPLDGKIQWGITWAWTSVLKKSRNLWVIIPRGKDVYGRWIRIRSQKWMKKFRSGRGRIQWESRKPWYIQVRITWLYTIEEMGLSVGTCRSACIVLVICFWWPSVVDSESLGLSFDCGQNFLINFCPISVCLSRGLN